MGFLISCSNYLQKNIDSTPYPIPRPMATLETFGGLWLNCTFAFIQSQTTETYRMQIEMSPSKQVFGSFSNIKFVLIQITIEESNRTCFKMSTNVITLFTVSLSPKNLHHEYKYKGTNYLISSLLSHFNFRHPYNTLYLGQWGNFSELTCQMQNENLI